MNHLDLVKRLYLLKNNPKLAENVSQAEILSLLSEVMSAFGGLKTAIENNKIKGPKGEDGITPVAGKDYPTINQVDAALSRELNAFTKKTDKLIKEIQQKLDSVKNGQDAVITQEMLEEAASIAVTLIDLPDFQKLVQTEITANPQTIRDGLELLQDDDKLEQSAIKNLIEDLREIREMIDRAPRGSGGTIGKNQVYNFIRQAVADGTIPGGTGGGHTIQDEGTSLTQRDTLNFVGAGVTVTDAGGKTVVTIPGGGGGGGATVSVPTGTVDAVNATFAVSAIPLWIASDGIIYFQGAGYSRSGLTITMDVPPSQFIRSIS